MMRERRDSHGAAAFVLREVSRAYSSFHSVSAGWLETTLSSRAHASADFLSHVSLQRSLYIAQNVLFNAAAPVTVRMRGPGKLGMDGELGRVGRTLERLSRCLAPLGYHVAGQRALELGPGRTCELLASFLLAGAESAAGVDTTVRVSNRCASPERLAEVADMLATRVDFLDAVGASAETVAQRRRQLSESGVDLEFHAYDGMTLPFPDRSIGLIFSKSVLEHVRLAHVRPLLREMHRVLRDDGVMVHVIDLRDHMHIKSDRVIGDWLDALTYSDATFRLMFSNRPVSINRLRTDDWDSVFRESGFRLTKTEQRLPLPAEFDRRRLAPRWQSLADQELDVAEIDVAASKER